MGVVANGGTVLGTRLSLIVAMFATSMVILRIVNAVWVCSFLPFFLSSLLSLLRCGRFADAWLQPLWGNARVYQSWDSTVVGLLKVHTVVNSYELVKVFSSE